MSQNENRQKRNSQQAVGIGGKRCSLILQAPASVLQQTDGGRRPPDVNRRERGWGQQAAAAVVDLIAGADVQQHGIHHQR